MNIEEDNIWNFMHQSKHEFDCSHELDAFDELIFSLPTLDHTDEPAYTILEALFEQTQEDLSPLLSCGITQEQIETREDPLHNLECDETIEDQNIHIKEIYLPMDFCDDKLKSEEKSITVQATKLLRPKKFPGTKTSSDKQNGKEEVGKIVKCLKEWWSEKMETL